MISLEKMRVSTRLLVAGALVCVGLASITAYTLIQTKAEAISQHKVELKSIVEVAVGIVEGYRKLETDNIETKEVAQTKALAALRSIRYGHDDYFFVIGFDGRALMIAGNPKTEGDIVLDKQDANGFKLYEAIVATGKSGQGVVNYLFPRAGQTEPKPKMAYVAGNQTWQWAIGTGVYVDDIDEAVQATAIRYVVMSLFVLLVVGFTGLMIARSIIRQLGGEPALAIELMSRAASGDLTIDVSSSAKGSILDSAGQMVRSIRQMVLEISQNTTKLSAGAEHISTASRQVAIASERQSDATASMAAAIEEMTVSINHISDSANETQQNSVNSVMLAEEGVARVESATVEIKDIAVRVTDTSERISKLEEHAKQISSIAAVIKDIAGQTNLLALNAAIEAARAGDMGRGFAVVADEVRKLAERTSVATVEIEKMIAGIQVDTGDVVQVMNATLPQVESGVKAATDAADALRQIKDGAQATLIATRDVADATKEQSMASNNIAAQVEEVATMVEETTAAMKSTAETAEDLEKIASELNLLVGKFRC